MKTDKCEDGVYQYFVRYYTGHGRPCNFQYLFNERSLKMHQGVGVAPKQKSDTPIVDITMKDGQVVKTVFHLEKNEIEIKNKNLTTFERLINVAKTIHESMENQASPQRKEITDFLSKDSGQISGLLSKTDSDLEMTENYNSFENTVNKIIEPIIQENGFASKQEYSMSAYDL